MRHKFILENSYDVIIQINTNYQQYILLKLLSG